MTTSQTTTVPGSTVAARPSFKDRYDHYIGGRWAPPESGDYFDNISPIDGKVFSRVACGNARDIEKAIDAAHAAFPLWSKSSGAYRHDLLLKIAEVIAANQDYLAAVETIDNGKPIRESRNADVPLMVDYFRYFAGAVENDEEVIDEHNDMVVGIDMHDPIGVVGQIIPWNFPLLMAASKIAPALAAGCCVIVVPAAQTPVSILCLMELIGDLIPPGVLNIVTGNGPETARLLSGSRRISIPDPLSEPRGSSVNIFFESVAESDDEFFDKAIEGALMFAFNKGEVSIRPSRILVHEKIYEQFINRVLERVESIKLGNPLDSTVMMGAQVSADQYDKVLQYIRIGKQEGARVLCGGEAFHQNSGLEHGYYVKPTLFGGFNKMRIFKENIFGPVSCVTTFGSTDEAIAIANDTLYGFGAGVWTRDARILYTVPRSVRAERVWVNCFPAYRSPFGGFEKPAFGAEARKEVLARYRQTKNVLISFSNDRLGFF
ncbi:MAG TPA: aldehyde dehydrogenase family protein [Puia sp.]|jgi:aldehyde dehydrogenase|nr:aldehyde dehydrogenase family protein [Puia sp.]